MKTIIKVKKEIEITILKIVIPIRYGEEDIPNNFPLRNGDTWSATINIDNGEILEWPKGEKGRLSTKVCDSGSYFLLDTDGNTVLSIEEDYVPNELVPGEYGDYIDLIIDENGFITNWHKNPSIEEFFIEDEY